MENSFSFGFQSLLQTIIDYNFIISYIVRYSDQRDRIFNEDLKFFIILCFKNFFR